MASVSTAEMGTALGDSPEVFWGLGAAPEGSGGCSCRVWHSQDTDTHPGMLWMSENPPRWGIPDGNKAQQEGQGTSLPIPRHTRGAAPILGKTWSKQGSPGSFTGPSSSVPKSLVPWAGLQPGRLWPGADFPQKHMKGPLLVLARAPSFFGLGRSHGNRRLLPLRSLFLGSLLPCCGISPWDQPPCPSSGPFPAQHPLPCRSRSRKERGISGSYLRAHLPFLRVRSWDICKNSNPNPWGQGWLGRVPTDPVLEQFWHFGHHHPRLTFGSLLAGQKPPQRPVPSIPLIPQPLSPNPGLGLCPGADKTSLTLNCRLGSAERAGRLPGAACRKPGVKLPKNRE